MGGWINEISLDASAAQTNKDLVGYITLPGAEELGGEEKFVRFLERYINCIGAPVFLLKPNGEVLRVNDSACEWFKLKDFSAYAGKKINFLELIQRVSMGMQGSRYEDFPLNAALETGRACSSAHPLKLAARGSVCTKMHATPVKNFQGQIIYLILAFLDITEDKHDRQSRNEFLHIATHELRNPLGVARGLIQLMQMRFTRRMALAPDLSFDLSPNDTEKNVDLFDFQKDLRQLSAVIRNIDQMSQIIYELLDLSRLESGRFTINNQSFDLMLLMEEVQHKMQVTTGSHSIIDTTERNQFSRGQCWVFGDSFRIEQVMVNLIRNAIKYSSCCGEIKLNLRKEGDLVIFSVTDQGVGITSEDQKKLFDKFYRVQRTGGVLGEGLGLGLYISTQIIKEHGGEIWVTSEVGQGSTFSFSLLEDDERKEKEEGAEEEKRE